MSVNPPAVSTRLKGRSSAETRSAVLDLDLVSLAGPGLAQLGEDYRQIIADRLAETAFMRDVHPITVRLGAGGADAAKRAIRAVRPRTRTRGR